mmetsp:Transcript_23252/g.53516  ORF Transcript_23252/g.53516 Transcript_23252/m.53516 type:complete len:304 (-) Transcript_23252:836-1747(-)
MHHLEADWSVALPISGGDHLAFWCPLECGIHHCLEDIKLGTANLHVRIERSSHGLVVPLGRELDDLLWKFADAPCVAPERIKQCKVLELEGDILSKDTHAATENRQEYDSNHDGNHNLACDRVDKLLTFLCSRVAFALCCKACCDCNSIKAHKEEIKVTRMGLPIYGTSCRSSYICCAAVKHNNRSCVVVCRASTLMCRKPLTICCELHQEGVMASPIRGRIERSLSGPCYKAIPRAIYCNRVTIVSDIAAPLARPLPSAVQAEFQRHDIRVSIVGLSIHSTFTQPCDVDGIHPNGHGICSIY